MKKTERIVAGILLALIAANGGFLLSLREKVSQLQADRAGLQTEIAGLQGTLAELREKETERSEMIPASADASAAPEEAPNAVNVKLSPYLYAVPGQELNIYFDNIIDDKDTRYDFNVICEIGGLYEGYYRVIPKISSGGGRTLLLYR